jgi:hypothetical protein
LLHMAAPCKYSGLKKVWVNESCNLLPPKKRSKEILFNTTIN